MCLILFAYKVTPGRKFILAANRDEFFSRPTAPMDFWHDNPDIIAGRDLKEGGTWLGISKTGKFAALTNYRDPAKIKKNPPSRGQIIKDYLTSNKNAADFLADLQKKADSFNGFNLLLSDDKSLFWFSNSGQETDVELCSDPLTKSKILTINEDYANENSPLIREFSHIKGGKPAKLIPGIYGLSNHLLNTPWPKIKEGTQSLKKIITEKNYISKDDLFHILESKKMPGDTDLPDTGVGIKWEKILAPIFINSPTYGTRSSSVMIINEDGHTLIAERSFNNMGDIQGEKEFRFLT